MSVTVSNGSRMLLSNATFLNGLSAFAVSIWVKSNATNTDQGFLIVDADGSDDQLSFRYDAAGASGGGTNLIKCGVNINSTEQTIESTSGTQTTNRQHLVFQWQSGGPLQLFINGVQDVLSSTSGNVSGTTSDIPSLQIGKGSKDGASGDGWNGEIGDLRFYNRSLSANEIETIYNSEGVDGIVDGLLARYSFEEGFEGQNLALPGITTSNPQAGFSNTANTTVTLSYTVPNITDQNLVLVVTATGEDGTNANTQASSASFLGAMTKVGGVNNTFGFGAGVAMFSKSVNANDSGTITVTFPGSISEKTIQAVTLVGSTTSVGSVQTATDTGSAASVNVTTANARARIITAMQIGNSNTLSAAGPTGHTLLVGSSSSSSAGAMGTFDTIDPQTVTGLTFTSSSTNRSALIAASFIPAGTNQTIHDLSEFGRNIVPRSSFTSNVVQTSEAVLRFVRRFL